MFKNALSYYKIDFQLLINALSKNKISFNPC